MTQKREKTTKPAKQDKVSRTMSFRISGAAAELRAGERLDALAAETGLDPSDVLRGCLLLGLARVSRDRGALLTAAAEAREALAA